MLNTLRFSLVYFQFVSGYKNSNKSVYTHAHTQSIITGIAMFSKKNITDSKGISPEKETSTDDDKSWVMLIVDDEPDIHKVTEMALKSVIFDGYPLTFINAYSGKEAKQILSERKDIALILLDVVMETQHAGLDVVKYIRDDLDNHLIRIVLRTGQPGEAPEERIFMEYDINDYKEKTDLDRKRLFTTVLSSIRSYRDIMKIEESRKYLDRNRAGLEKVIHSSARLFEARSISDFTSGLLEQIASILFIDNDSMVLHVQGASAIGDNPTDWKIVSTNGELAKNNAEDMLEVEKYLKLACTEQKSIFKDDRFVGYFATKSGKITLTYLEGCDKLDPLGKQLLDIFSQNITLAFENINLEKEVTETQSEVILRLGEVLETRSRETGNHVRRLALLSSLVGEHLGMDEEECIELLNASPMHDIGKVAIPDSILMKPGRFTDDEFEKMRYHAEAGYQMLKGSPRSLMQSAAIIARQHHERYDGKGYPQGLAGDDIHLYARIVSIVDVFDALMHRRCYKEPWTLEQTLDVLKEGSGTQFDPRIIEVFLAIVPKAIDILNKYPDEAQS